MALAPADSMLGGIRSLMFGPSRSERDKAATAPLMLVGVVQANEVLFDPERTEYAPAVFVWTKDGRARLDFAWMAALTAKLGKVRDYQGSDPALQGFATLLNDEESRFEDHPVPAELTGGVKALCYTGWIGPDRLPGGIVPDDRVLPALYFEQVDEPRVIPPECYGAPVHQF